MSKCYVCKRKVPITVDTRETFSASKMCLSCLQRAMVELDENSNIDEWKKKIREEIKERKKK